MIQSGLTELGAVLQGPSSRRRDWVLFPALSLLTICFLAGTAELLSRWFYPVTQVGFQNCFVTNDPTGDSPVKPNSVCWEQTAESTLKAEYRFNSRGHRAGTDLDLKPPGTYRIVLLGSSFTQGLFVPREKTFAALLPEELSQETGRRIEVYNEATGGKFRGGPYPRENSAQHFDQVLAAQPDMILLVITPGDIRNSGSGANADSPKTGGRQEDQLLAEGSAKRWSHWKKITASIASGTFSVRLKSRWESTRTSIVLKHLLIASESQDEYIRSYIKSEDNADFLKTKPDLRWEMQLREFDAEVAEIVRLAKSAGVPFVAVFVPNRPQAAMISMGDWPPGFDPFKVEKEVRDTIESSGGRVIDILRYYPSVPSPERHYFPVDGHPDSDGHAIIARLLAQELTRGAVPTLKARTQNNIKNK